MHAQNKHRQNEKVVDRDRDSLLFENISSIAPRTNNGPVVMNRFYLGHNEIFAENVDIQFMMSFVMNVRIDSLIYFGIKNTKFSSIYRRFFSFAQSLVEQ